ncbi:IclR family transcriptional regulator [Streptosporangium saharense]|uniref:IclR family transcriptional regulator n=1 Tax=Streptosporangium saharense TaxID=1706840 RepID=UPI0036833788
MGMETARTADHALLALRTLADNGPMTVTDLAAELGVSPTAAHRVIATLHASAIVRRCEDGRYDVGPRLIRLTDHLLQYYAKQATPAMLRLAESTGGTVVLNALQGDSTIALHQVTATRTPLRIEYRLGYATPFTGSPGGLTILAHLHPSRRDRLVSEAGTKGLRERLDRIVADGFLISGEEVWADAVSVSAPILDENLGVIGSLSAVVTTDPAEHRKIVTQVTQAAARVASRSSEFSGPGSTQPGEPTDD